MRRKVILLAIGAVLASLAIVPVADAASRSLKVTSSYEGKDFCRPAPDQFRYALEFFAKIKRRNAPKPKRVTIKYKVINSSNGQVVVSGSATLTPKNKFRKKVAPITLPVGTPVSYDLLSSYKSPFNGRSVRATGTFPDQIPTAEQIDAINAQNPSAPLVPNCV